MPPESPGHPRNRRGLDTRARILVAGDECFEEHGLDLTLDQVAERAGTTRMTVHRHTGGREQLVTHLVLRASGRLAGELTAILERPAPTGSNLADALIHTVVAIRATPSLARLFSGGDVTGPWRELDPDERVLGVIHDFYRPHLAAMDEAGMLRSGVTADDAVSWLLSQVLLTLVVPSVATDVEDFFTRFVLPAVLKQRSDP
ncbi:MAG: TetR/AcrR family transcriptional regulator [Microthrixaceae bacterium]|jgi:TetR/AcrR family transcriptional repressor of uid operon|nr:TetR/AcrR family transcriptional regulator [Microthrixaceae bacterium]